MNKALQYSSKGRVKHPMDEIEGLPGELIDRLIELLNNDALGDHMWYNVGRYAEVFLGGQALGHIQPDTGKTPCRGRRAS